LNIAVHDRGHGDRSAGGQDMFEIDAFFFEVAFALRKSDRREVQTGGRRRQSNFDERLCLSHHRR